MSTVEIIVSVISYDAVASLEGGFSLLSFSDMMQEKMDRYDGISIAKGRS